ncbi:MAG: molybdopterin converting factor subunit 1 [Bacteroidota bacterium]
MIIEILFFGMARDIVNENKINLELNENKDVNFLVNLLEEKYPKFSSINSFSVAVNEEYVKKDIILKNNDTVAIIPPVSGG